MHRLAWLVVALAALEAGWMAFDGGRALLVGDYITPRSGPSAGQLGLWARLVSAAGIDPRSTGVKSFLLIFGSAWLGVAAAYALGLPWAWKAMLGCAILGLGYLPIGTLLSLAQIVLLLLPPLRDSAG